ncbi:MAG TPA: hypothetical protein DCW90_15480 [Lachnospiraceae bacterium]|nr:hypothetical protein [uncultured Lachnoclostridium sp.]HAU86832.1 hypothetical protein [Lachnospiraceae bacterium]
MDSIKNMLIGITFLLVTIIIHLAYESLLYTDFIGVLGVIIVVQSCLTYNKENGKKDDKSN